MRLIRSLISNIATLFLALVLALFVWATAIRTNDPIETRLWQIDVETVGLPADGTLVTGPPNTASITIEGPTSALNELSPESFTGIVDLSEAPFGESEVEIDLRESYEGIRLLNKFPETVTIRLEQIITRDIPVLLNVRGEVARGHRAGTARIEPSTVQITGVSSRVSQLTESRVTVFLDNAREDVSELRRPTFYDVQGNVASVAGLVLNPTEVEVIIPVIELAGFAEKPIAVNWVGEPAQGYRLLNFSIEPDSVQVTGAPAILESLRIQTEPIDINGLTESATLQASLELPEGITLVEVQPIVVTVEVEPILTSDVVREAVEIRALGEGLEATLDPEEVRVFLFGPLPVLDSLGEDDVRVTVDLLNRDVGTHVIEPFVTVSASEVEFRSTQPAVVTVFITHTITSTNGITNTLPVTETLSLTAPPWGAQVGRCSTASACEPLGLDPPFADFSRRQWLV